MRHGRLEPLIVTRRKSIGAYYSPHAYASALVEWALADSTGGLLDPSYGGCVFLEAGLSQLASRLERPAESVFGADVDEDTDVWSDRLVAGGVPRSNLIRDDFLSLRPGIELPLVPAVVGNPPYVRHHFLSQASVASAKSAMDRAGVRLDGRASLWAYFVVHAASFVADGGRMALILPGALLHADYAGQVIAHLRAMFRHIDLVRMGQRIFPDADEETVILLAADAGSKCQSFEIHDAFALPDLVKLVATIPTPADGRTGRVPAEDHWKSDLLQPNCQEVLATALADKRVRALGDIAKIAIGTVTGANSFFTCSDVEMQALGLDAGDLTVPVLARSAMISKPEFTSADFEGFASHGNRVRLLTLPKKHPIDGRTRLGKRIAAAEVEGVQHRSHCRRTPWWSLNPVSIPDAFLPYMGGEFRGVSANSAGAASTNAIHQVTWRVGLEPKVTTAATASSWSVLTALCAELYGRQYGGGVLKLELAAAAKLPVLGEALMSEADLCQPQDAASARQFANALLKRDLDLSDKDIATLTVGLETLKSRRRLPRETPSRAGG